MQYLDLSKTLPQHNLALDELLLEQAEHGIHGEVLRMWESPVHFVVLGAGSKPDLDVHMDACAASGIPVMRRASGGGTVLQGPGCLNYALVLDTRERPECATIDSTTRFVLGGISRAIHSLVGHSVELKGTSDLTAEGLKFSGNAQKRKRRFALFHGTILYGFDLALISQFLKHPPRQPDYRGSRAHENFVRNLPIQPHAIRLSLRETFEAHRPLELTEASNASLDAAARAIARGAAELAAATN